MILILVALVYLIYIFNSNRKLNNHEKDLFKIFAILVFFVISIKPFYLINLPLFLILLYNNHTRSIFLKLLFSPTFFYCLSFLFFTFLFTFLNSGCLIFPLSQTCFYNLEWSLDKSMINDVKIWFELWAKGGAGPNFVVEDRIGYINNFEWLTEWLSNYFFNKVSDFILGIISVIFIFYITYFRFNLKKEEIKTRIYIIYIFLFFFLIEWFLNHPTLRYGGYHILALIFFIPASLHLSQFKFRFKDYYKKTFVLVLIITTIFISRNISRLINENNLYNYNLIENSDYKFIGGDRDFYFRYNALMKNEKDFSFINLFGKKIKIIKSN